MSNVKSNIFHGLLIVSTLMVLVSVVPGASAETAIETFEDDTTLANPTSPFYTFSKSASNSFVSTSLSHSPSKSLYFNALSTTQTTTYVDFQYTTAVNCAASGAAQQTSQYTFWVNLNSLPAAATGDRYALSRIAGSGGDLLYLSISPTGAMTLASSIFSAITLTGTMPINTWVDISLFANCSLQAATANQFGCIQSLVLSQNVCTSPATTSVPSGTYNRLDFVLGTASPFSRAINIDDISIDQISTTPTVSPTATVALTGVVGFDASENGLFTVARTNSGANVKIFDGNTLTEQYTEATACNISNGVVAIQDVGIGFLKCASGSNINAIKFTNSNGQTDSGTGRNSVFTDCEIADCDGTFDLDPLANEDSFSDLVVLDNFFTTHETNSVGQETDQHFITIGYSGTNGKVYSTRLSVECGTHATGSSVADCPGVSREMVYDNNVNYGSGVIDDICGPNNLLMYAAESGFSPHGFAYNVVATQSQSGATNQYPSVSTTLTDFYTGPSATSSSTEIDCSRNTIIVGKGTGNVVITNPVSGTIPVSLTTTGISSVSISLDGKWASYTTTTTTTIINASSGVVLATITNPTGTVFESKMDQFGQKLYLATSTQIVMYDIHAITTVVPGGTGCVNDCITTSSTSTSGSTATSTNPFNGGGTGGGIGNAPSHPFGINISYTAEGLGVSILSIQVLVGLILMVVFAIWMWKGTQSIIATILGAGLGLIVATVMGLVPPWVIMAIVLFLIIILGKMIFGGFSGGDES